MNKSQCQLLFDTAVRYDISLPVNLFPAVVDATRKRLLQLGDRMPCSALNVNDGMMLKKCLQSGPGVAEVVCWGHLGDGNLHLNVAVKAKSPEVGVRPLFYQV